MITSLYLATALLFFITAIALYALIISYKNYLVLFLLIPVSLVASVFTGYTIFALQGTPLVNQLPIDQQIEVVWAKPSKPWIYLIVKVGEEPVPMYHKIDYTENNLKQLQQAMQSKGNAQQGKFQKKNSDSNSSEYTFVDASNVKLPNKNPADEMANDRRPTVGF